MKSLAKQYFEDFTEFREAFDAELALYDIVILDNFLLNKENIERYYANYISNNTPKIALCGLNPGRF